MKVKPEGLRGAANICSRGGRHPLTAMFGADETSFGGGYAAMPLIQGQVVTAHHWLSMEEFTDLITISQMTPGPIAINSATCLLYTSPSPRDS